jgi:hypothetical protein
VAERGRLAGEFVRPPVVLHRRAVLEQHRRVVVIGGLLQRPGGDRLGSALAPRPVASPDLLPVARRPTRPHALALGPIVCEESAQLVVHLPSPIPPAGHRAWPTPYRHGGG